MPRRSTGRTEHVATRVTVEERELIERAAHERVRRHPQLLSLSDYVRRLVVEGARRELGLQTDDDDDPPAPVTRRRSEVVPVPAARARRRS